ncbi:hypothetical protein Dimus_034620 [Dionaea muscipula]
MNQVTTYQAERYSIPRRPFLVILDSFTVATFFGKKPYFQTICQFFLSTLQALRSHSFQQYIAYIVKCCSDIIYCLYLVIGIDVGIVIVCDDQPWQGNWFTLAEMANNLAKAGCCCWPINKLSPIVCHDQPWQGNSFTLIQNVLIKLIRSSNGR